MSGVGTETKKLLLATRNPAKARELAGLLAGSPFELVSLAAAGIASDVQETGQTIEDNARLKASGYATASGLLTLADDSGLEVDALHGEPGVMSARYGGHGLSDQDRVRLLLERMKTVPGWRRQARFRAVLALAGPPVLGGVIATQGIIEGAIAHEPIGANGFGYDPVFWLKDRAKTMAELSADEKNTISHRGQAARNMAEILLRLAT